MPASTTSSTTRNHLPRKAKEKLSETTPASTSSSTTQSHPKDLPRKAKDKPSKTTSTSTSSSTQQNNRKDLLVRKKANAKLNNKMSTSTSSSKVPHTHPTAITDPSYTGFTLEEFALFPKLPPEIRFRIWTESLPPPRTVAFIPGSSPALAVFSACRESRKVTREKSYGIISLDFPQPLPTFPGAVLINFETDILNISSLFGISLPGQSSGLPPSHWFEVVHKMHPLSMAKVKRIMIGVPDHLYKFLAWWATSGRLWPARWCSVKGKEVIFVLWGNRRTIIEDLMMVELDSIEVGHVQQVVMGSLTRSLKEARAQGDFSSLQVKFAIAHKVSNIRGEVMRRIAYG